MPKPHAEDCVRALVPPGVSERLSVYYGRHYLSKRIMTPFWRKFNQDGAFQDYICHKAGELFDIIFDEESDSWGNWPADPQECAGIGFILGKLLRNDIDEMLLQANEVELARLDALVKSMGISLFDYVVKHLEDYKRPTKDKEETSGSISLFIWPCPRSF